MATAAELASQLEEAKAAALAAADRMHHLEADEGEHRY